MKKRRDLSILLAGAIAFGMTGCGAAKTAETQSGAIADSTEESTKTGTTEAISQNGTGEQVLRVGMEGTYAPYTYHDDNGELTGYEVDVANAIGEKIGYQVEFVETEWDSMFEALDAGNFDVVMNQVTMTDERKQKYDFSTPYIFSTPVLIVAADNTDITSFDDVNGKKAAEGLTSNFNQIAQDYGAEIVGQDEFPLAMECVLSGEADCAINDKLTYAYWTKVKGDTTSTKIVAELDEPTESGIVTEKGNDELLEKINGAISELLADGTISEISEKYFGTDISNQ